MARNRPLFYLSILFLLSLCFITGCNELSLFSKATSVPRHEWITKWLSKPVCSPPCWEQITPGVTSIDEAEEILQQIPQITGIRGPIKGPLGFEELDINWNFDHSTDGGAIRTDAEGTIKSILLRPEKDQNLRIREVIEVAVDEAVIEDELGRRSGDAMLDIDITQVQ